MHIDLSPGMIDVTPVLIPSGEEQVLISIVGDTDRDVVFFCVGNDYCATQDIVVKLQGAGATTRILGIIIAKERQQRKLSLTIRHEVPQTTAQVAIRGIALDQARVELEGMLRIEPGAKGADTFFRADMLLLSEQAKATIVPSLEIIENEVKGGHAATVTQLDPDQLFYLSTRGVSPDKGTRLLVNGFLHEPFGNIQDGESRAYWKGMVDEAVGEVGSLISPLET